VAHRRRGTKSFLFVTDRNRGRRDYELQVSITSKCREASVAKQVSRCREASVAKQVSRSNCGEATVAKQVSEASVAKQVSRSNLSRSEAPLVAHTKKDETTQAQKQLLSTEKQTDMCGYRSQKQPCARCERLVSCFSLLCFAGIPYLSRPAIRDT
jgi:hypothetical protein